MYEKSNRLAYVLRKKGISPGEIVGIISQRSFEMIIGLYGILIAGGAYLPIAPESPLERIQYMLADSKVKILLIQNELKERISFAGSIINLKEIIDYHGQTEIVPVLAMDPIRMSEVYGIDFLGLETGEFMQEGDQNRCIIGYNIAHELFDSDISVGKKIQINEKN